jgi:hypothetical protein
MVREYFILLVTNLLEDIEAITSELEDAVPFDQIFGITQMEDRSWWIDRLFMPTHLLPIA